MICRKLPHHPPIRFARKSLMTKFLIAHLYKSSLRIPITLFFPPSYLSSTDLSPSSLSSLYAALLAPVLSGARSHTLGQQGYIYRHNESGIVKVTSPQSRDCPASRASVPRVHRQPSGIDYAILLQASHSGLTV